MKCEFMVCITGPHEDRINIMRELKRIPRPEELNPMLSSDNPQIYMTNDALFFGGFAEIPTTLLFMGIAERYPRIRIDCDVDDYLVLEFWNGLQASQDVLERVTFRLLRS